MKKYYLITKDATKYWKKAIKNDRVMVANHDNFIYIVNGYNAFKFPALPAIWDDIARAAFMVDIPEAGAAFQHCHGEKQTADAANVVNIFENATKDTTPAARSPFQFDSKDITVRLYKNDNGTLSGVNIVYDAMVDPLQADNICCGGRYSPIIFKNDLGFTALIMPVRLHDAFPEKIRDTFAQLLEV